MSRRRGATGHGRQRRFHGARSITGMLDELRTIAAATKRADARAATTSLDSQSTAAEAEKEATNVQGHS